MYVCMYLCVYVYIYILYMLTCNICIYIIVIIIKKINGRDNTNHAERSFIFIVVPPQKLTIVESNEKSE